MRPDREPVRTCVACRQTAGKRSLVRLVRTPEGAVAVDTTGRAHGRGAYLHPDPDCLATARKRHALERALKTQVPETIWADLSQGATT